MNSAPLNLFDYEQLAQQKMPAPSFAYYAGGTADNLTLQRNRTAFEEIQLRPRVLVDVSHINMETTVQERTIAMPIMIAPAAMHKLAHPDGELATARAAKTAGTIQILSTFSTVPVETVAEAGYATWYQLYMATDRAITERMVERAEAAGCEAVVLTVDVPVSGLRENLTRAQFSVPEAMPRPHFDGFDDGSEAMTFGRFVQQYMDASLTWKDVEWLQSITRLPVWVKGILRGDDAKLAVDHGVSGIIVSNHGGRQLDTAIAGITALPNVVSAVDGQIEIIVDGGVRRGVDVVKAMALGAKAVLVGRPVLWGLVADGEAGATHVLHLLQAELENALALCGCPDLSAIMPDLLHTN